LTLNVVATLKRRSKKSIVPTVFQRRPEIAVATAPAHGTDRFAENTPSQRFTGTPLNRSKC
jgi:hypothetical protein